MKKLIIRSLVVCACLLSLSLAASAQKRTATENANGSSAGVAVLNATGKLAVIVVGSAAKVAWGTTKFVARDRAVPVAKSLVKPLVVHAAPAAAKFALKESARYLLPLAVKLSIL